MKKLYLPFLLCCFLLLITSCNLFSRQEGNCRVSVDNAELESIEKSLNIVSSSMSDIYPVSYEEKEILKTRTRLVATATPDIFDIKAKQAVVSVKNPFLRVSNLFQERDTGDAILHLASNTPSSIVKQNTFTGFEATSFGIRLPMYGFSFVRVPLDPLDPEDLDILNKVTNAAKKDTENGFLYFTFYDLLPIDDTSCSLDAIEFSTSEEGRFSVIKGWRWPESSNGSCEIRLPLPNKIKMVDNMEIYLTANVKDSIEIYELENGSYWATLKMDNPLPLNISTRVQKDSSYYGELDEAPTSQQEKQLYEDMAKVKCRITNRSSLNTDRTMRLDVRFTKTKDLYDWDEGSVIEDPSKVFDYVEIYYSNGYVSNMKTATQLATHLPPQSSYTITLPDNITDYCSISIYAVKEVEGKKYYSIAMGTYYCPIFGR